MNREIKFRAWDNVDEKMLFIGEETDVSFSFDSSGITATKLQDYNDYDDTNFSSLEHLKYMQYTGLSDENGVEIYEGDIVEVELEDRNENPWLRKAKIIFEGCTFMLCDLNPSNDVWNSVPEANGPIHYYLEAEHEFEVIGNIYENPNLLEGDVK